MSKPVWSSQAGLLATITENISTSLNVLATGSATIIYSLLNGDLPSGLTLSSTGTISGTPDTVLELTSSTFTIRAKNTEASTDRTFYIDVDGEDQLTWATSPTLLVGPNNEPFVYYNQYVKTYITATSDTGTVSYSLISGDFPKNLELLANGTIEGYIQEYISDVNTFTFVVSATNSISFTSTSFNIVVNPLAYEELLPLQFIGDNDLGQFKSNATYLISIPIYDPKPYLGPVTYALSSGTLPANLVLNSSTGIISGYIPPQLSIYNTETFTVNVSKTYKTQTTSTSKEFSITTYFPPIIKKLTWETTGNLGTLYSKEISTLYVKAISTESTFISKYVINNGTLPPDLSLENDGSISGIIAVNTATSSSSITYAFNVDAYDQNNKIVANSNFDITTVQTVSTDFTRIYFQPLLSLTKRKEYQEFTNNKEIFIPDWIYRPFDSNFGVRRNLELTIDYGIEKKHLSVYHALLHDTFYKRRFQFGTLKNAVASRNNKVFYEVVYFTILDGDGDDFSVNTTLRSNNNTEPELSYFNNSAFVDLIDPNDYSNTIYAIRTILRENLQFTDYASPLYWNTIQPGANTELGFFPHIPICYTKPGKSKYVINKINDLNIDFKLFDLEIDRLYLSKTDQY